MSEDEFIKGRSIVGVVVVTIVAGIVASTAAIVIIITTTVITITNTLVHVIAISNHRLL